MTEKIELEFVDRDDGLACLAEMRAGRRLARIMLVKGDTGFGKSWLLRRAKSEHRDLQTALVDLGHHTAQDPLVLVSSLREQMPGVDWKPVDEVLQQVGGSYLVDIRGFDRVKLRLVLERRLDLEELRTLCFDLDVDFEELNATGRQGKARELVLYMVRRERIPELVDRLLLQRPDVSLEDVLEDSAGGRINMPGAEDAQMRDWLTDKVTARLIQALGLCTPILPALILLDTFEKRTKPTGTWLLEKLLPALRDRSLPGVLIAIAGREVPALGEQWGSLVASIELRHLPIPAIEEYWTVKRRQSGSEIGIIIRLSGGNPYLLAQMADNAAMASTGSVQ